MSLYFQYGFKRRSSTGYVDLDTVYQGGLHATGPDMNFKVFNSDAHYVEYDDIAVFASDRLQVWTPSCDIINSDG